MTTIMSLTQCDNMDKLSITVYNINLYDIMIFGMATNYHAKQIIIVKILFAVLNC